MTAYIQHTLWERAGHMLDTQYGKVNYLAWLGLESERIGNSGGVTDTRQRKDKHRGFVYALFVVPDPRNIKSNPPRGKEEV